MQIFVLEILEHWFLYDNSKVKIGKKQHISAWADEDDAMHHLKHWINNKSNNLETDLLLILNLIIDSNTLTSRQKFSEISKLSLRFAKFFGLSKKRNILTPSTWVKVNLFECKLRGSAFE